MKRRKSCLTLSSLYFIVSFSKAPHLHNPSTPLPPPSHSFGLDICLDCVCFCFILFVWMTKFLFLFGLTTLQLKKRGFLQRWRWCNSSLPGWQGIICWHAIRQSSISRLYHHVLDQGPGARQNPRLRIRWLVLPTPVFYLDTWWLEGPVFPV